MHLLVATDLRPASRAAERLGANLARRLGAAATLLYRPLRPKSAAEENRLPRRSSAAKSTERSRTRIQAALNDKAEALFDGVAVGTAVLDPGDPALAIARRSREEDVDLIVMGTTSRRGGWRSIARPASLAEGVAYEARSPVLVVPRGASPQLERGCHIVVATDPTPHCDRVSDMAALWAEQLQGNLSLLHAYLPTVAGASAEGAPSCWVREAYRGEAHLEASAQRCQGLVGAVQLTPSLEAGRAICRKAEDEDPDLVVMGCRRRSAWRRQALGSVSDLVLRTVDNPVLLVPLR